jgi:hypothetical protein
MSWVLLAGSFLWLTVAIVLCIKIPRWLGVGKYRVVVSLTLFPVVMAIPLADELLGGWQFYRLCNKDAVVTLSPQADQVKRARREPETRRDLDGYLIPIHTWDGQIVDVDTGKVFMTTQSLFTSGGLLRRYLNGPEGQATSCHPKNYHAVQKKLNLFELLEQGEVE